MSGKREHPFFITQADAALAMAFELLHEIHQPITVTHAHDILMNRDALDHALERLLKGHRTIAGWRSLDILSKRF